MRTTRLDALSQILSGGSEADDERDASSLGIAEEPTPDSIAPICPARSDSPIR